MAKITFQVIAPIGVQTLHQNVPKHITDITTMARMPSRTSCEDMLDYLNLSSAMPFLVRWVPIDTLLKVHTLRDIAENVKKEKMWLKKAVKVPSEHCFPPNGLIDEYKKLIFQNSDSTVVLNRTILPSDLATLTGCTWLGLAVIQGVLDIINTQSSDTRAFILNDLIGLTGSQLQKLVETKSAKTNFFTFIVNVGGDINETFVATPSKPGCHWPLPYIDSVDNKCFYCGTLGWAPRKELNDIVVHIMDAFTRTTIIKKPVQVSRPQEAVYLVVQLTSAQATASETFHFRLVKMSVMSLPPHWESFVP